MIIYMAGFWLNKERPFVTIATDKQLPELIHRMRQRCSKFYVRNTSTNITVLKHGYTSLPHMHEEEEYIQTGDNAWILAALTHRRI